MGERRCRKKTFISYRHSDGEWVCSRLKPVLEAAGVEVLIDAERFEAGRAVVGQMDALQDTAQRHLLVITEAYLDSDYCRHEMDRAIATDPAFATGNVIPIRRDDVKWPRKLTGKATAPMFVDLCNDRDDAPWDLLLKSCEGQLDVSPTQWLDARDEVARYLQRDQSVNLVCDGGLKAWRPLLEHLHSVKPPKTPRTELKTSGD